MNFIGCSKLNWNQELPWTKQELCVSDVKILCLVHLLVMLYDKLINDELICLIDFE